MMKDILQVWEGSWQPFYIKYPKFYIFLETSGKIQLNKDDTNHHDTHKEPQDDGGCPPSMIDILF